MYVVFLQCHSYFAGQIYNITKRMVVKRNSAVLNLPSRIEYARLRIHELKTTQISTDQVRWSGR
jgi:hypothetical protein